MTAEITQKVNAVVSEYAAPTLKRHGFSKSGQRFWNRTEDAIWVFEFQRDKYNQGASGQFTVNLGLYHPRWAEAVVAIPRMSYMGDVKTKPAEQNCYLRERLDELYPVPDELRARNDTWWAVSARQSVDDLGASVVNAIDEYALPWFESYDGLEDAIAHLDERYSRMRNAWLQKVCAMIGRGLLGDRERAAELYALAREDAPNRGAMDNDFRDWKKSLGL